MRLAVIKLTVAVAITSVLFWAAPQAGAETAEKEKMHSKKMTAKEKKAMMAEKKEKPADFFQVSFAFGVPSASWNVNVDGLKVGAPLSGGPATVRGIEAAVLAACTEHVIGLQASMITTVGKDVTGIQFAIVNIAQRVKGMQFSMFNVAKEWCTFQLGILNMTEGDGLQLGLVNYNPDAIIPLLPILNFNF